MLQPRLQPSFSTALFLARRDDLLNVDRALVRGCGIRQGRFLARGRDALEWLERRGAGSAASAFAFPDLIVCDLLLEDMDALEFVRALRSLEAAADLPVLLLADSLPAPLASALGQLGRAAVLCRPYTQNDLQATLAFLRNEENRSPVFTASPVPVRVLPFRRPARRAAAPRKNALALGRELLHAGEPAKAIEAFLEALSSRPDRATAYRGLARAWERLGDIPRACRFLRAAARFSIIDEDFFNARRALGRERDLAQEACVSTLETSIAANPLYLAAIRLLREGRAKSAARAVLQGLAFTPNLSPLAALRQVCDESDAPWEVAGSLCDALEACGGANTAVIFRRLLIDARVEARPSRLGFLADMLTVARQTYRMYKAATD